MEEMGDQDPMVPTDELHPKARCAHVNMKLGPAAIGCWHCTHAPKFTLFQIGIAVSARGLMVVECTSVYKLRFCLFLHPID